MRFCPTCGSRFSNDVRFCPHDGQPVEDLEEATAVTPDPWIGRVVDGRYRVDRILGEGGMGVVYLVVHVGLNKRMAMKVLREELACDPEVVQRFVQEAQTSTSMGHPNIIDVSDFGRMPDGAVYFVMEYLEGESLTQRIERKGPLSVLEAVEIAEQIASALGAAHAHGVIHRDLKPDNVFLIRRGDRDDFVKVLDFGIAKVGGAPSKLTRTGMVFGTPHYMSPEQAAGQVVDGRADVYALGVILYEMFTGVVPFDAETFMGVLTKQMFEEPIPPTARGASAEMGNLEPVVLRALAKRPESRYQTMDALLRDIDTVRRGGTIALTSSIAPPGRIGPPTAGGSEPRVERRWPFVLFAAATFLLIGGSAVGALYALWHRAEARFVAGEARDSAMPPASPTVSVAPTAPDQRPTPEAPGRTPSPATDVSAPTPPALPTAQAPVTAASVAATAASVRITSTPSGAVVSLDNTLIGQTPLEVPASITSSGRQVVLRLAGYDDRVLAADELVDTTLVHAELEPSSVRRPAVREISRVSGPSPRAAPPTPAPVSVAPPAPRVAPAQRPSEVVDPWGL